MTNFLKKSLPPTSEQWMTLDPDWNRSVLVGAAPHFQSLDSVYCRREAWALMGVITCEGSVDNKLTKLKVLPVENLKQNCTVLKGLTRAKLVSLKQAWTEPSSHGLCVGIGGCYFIQLNSKYWRGIEIHSKLIDFVSRKNVWAY